MALDVFAAAWPQETHDALMSRVATAFGDRILPHVPARRMPSTAARGRVAGAALMAFEAAEPGSDRVRRRRARPRRRRPRTRTGCAAWVEGRSLPEGLEGDSDFRWIAVQTLARLGRADDALIAAVEADDTTLSGRLAGLTARAARPGAADKEWAWAEITENRTRSNYELNALATGFWSSGSLETLRPYAARYVTDIPRLREWVGADALDRVATLAFPSRVVEPETVELVRAAMAAPGRSPRACAGRWATSCPSSRRR